MLRSSIALTLLAIAVSCGGPSKPSSNTVPEGKLDPGAATAPVDATATPAPAAPAAPAPPPPAAPTGPIKVAFDASKATVKLINPGKGKRTPLRLAPKAATKQAVELLMDAVIEQGATGQPGQTVTMPTVVLAGTGEVTAVASDGTATYHTVIETVDARTRPDQSLPADAIKAQIISLAGMVIDGSVAPSGLTGTTTYMIEKPTAATAGAIESLKLMLPTWVPLPTQPIGVGAQWQVSSPAEFNGIATTQLTTYKLVARTATAITITGETKVEGGNQSLQGVEVSDISGQGKLEVTIDPSKLYPKMTSTVSTKVRLKQGTEDVTITMQIGSGFAPK
jgi:hypothetical protein